MSEKPQMFPEGITVKLIENQVLRPFMSHHFYMTSHGIAPKQVGDDYQPLAQVLCAAFAQAEGGKGKERHAKGDPFMEQPIMAIGRLLKSADGEVYQAIKKMREGLMMAQRGEHDSAIKEFLGAINYAAAAAILISEQKSEKVNAEFFQANGRQKIAASRAERDTENPISDNVSENAGIDQIRLSDDLNRLADKYGLGRIE